MYIKGTRLNGQVIRFENIFLMWDEKTKYYWLSNLTSKRFNPKRSKYDKLPIIEKIRRNNNKIGKLALITFSKTIRSFNKFTQSFVTIGGKNKLIINK